MWIGIPVICPDLPYARTICGEQGIYFDPHNIASIYDAVLELNQRRKTGWWPDWKKQLINIPEDWNSVAKMMLDVACSESEINS